MWLRRLQSDRTGLRGPVLGSRDHLGEREGHDAVIGHGIAEEASPGRSDHNVLLSVPALVGHWSCLGGTAQLHGP